MWPLSRRPRATPSGALELSPQSPDDPVPFGFKNTWWALPTADTSAVVAAIKLQNARPANWQTGIQHAYERSIFVAPPIERWTLVVGFYLPPMSQNARNEVLAPLLELSQKFGTALVFATHRVVDYHVWAKAVGGSLIRGYGYVGESGRTFWNEGPTTPEERRLGLAFFDEQSPAAEDPAYWEREDLSYPDEMTVMDIAREWSISPSDLEEYKPEVRSLGVLGTHSELLKRDGEHGA